MPPPPLPFGNGSSIGDTLVPIFGSLSKSAIRLSELVAAHDGVASYRDENPLEDPDFPAWFELVDQDVEIVPVRADAQAFVDWYYAPLEEGVAWVEAEGEDSDGSDTL